MFCLKNIFTAISAQRLSASEIRHKYCLSVPMELTAVLNAFRHQRFDTVFHDAIAIVVCRAQRLSASEIRHEDWANEIAAKKRAQRLSASEIRHEYPYRSATIENYSAQRLSASEIRHSVAL